MDLLGERVELKGWPGYNGGMDTGGNAVSALDMIDLNYTNFLTFLLNRKTSRWNTLCFHTMEWSRHNVPRKHPTDVLVITIFADCVFL